MYKITAQVWLWKTIVPQLICALTNWAIYLENTNSLVSATCVCEKRTCKEIAGKKRWSFRKTWSREFFVQRVSGSQFRHVFVLGIVHSEKAAKQRRQQNSRLKFTWNRMGDRGYREHSAWISCCHDATGKRGAFGAVANIDANVQRFPHYAPTSKLGVYSWQSRHFGVSLSFRVLFSHTRATEAPRDEEVRAIKNVRGAICKWRVKTTSLTNLCVFGTVELCLNNFARMWHKKFE